MSTFEPSGLPEFFATDMQVQMLPGECVRVVYIHPIEGDTHAVIMPWACWVQMRMKCEVFQLQHVEGRKVPMLAH